ncbi:hypothetical protein [Porphyromonas circumdentaria]|uniref:hypothetical protein n=1 Tax=Porphyromonas circumdentaria TaxID=29524 RepID=UPI0026DD5B13|nr:hypothetical protein [Porphyromonas circumdentaria]MDO4721940.1 hypothetical protein [Porphyromonas circumdentaria]
MRHSIIKLYSILLLFIASFTTYAQNLPLTSTYNATSLGIGGVILSDEYLTPLRYGGTIYNLRTEQEKSLTCSFPSLLHLDASISYASTLNPAYTAKMDFVRGELQAEGLYIWALPYGIKLAAGPGLRLTLGGRLHSRNGNNPGTLDAKSDLTIGAILAYRLPFEQWPIAIRLHTSYGVLGLSNHLEYGASYYEQEFVRNGIIRAFHLTHPFNQNYLSTRFSLDIPLWEICTLHLGYQWSFDRSSLKHRIRSMQGHIGFIGFSIERLSFWGRRAMHSDTHKTLLFDTFH